MGLKDVLLTPLRVMTLATLVTLLHNENCPGMRYLIVDETMQWLDVEAAFL